MIHNVTQFLVDLWKKIKQGSSVPPPSILEDDIVVFVVGPTGSGKSWFIKEATRAEGFSSSRGYHPSTTAVQAVRCDLTDEAKIDLGQEKIKSIVFVDTPSFLTGCDDIDAQKEIRKWVEQIRHKPRHLGILYMHRIETDPSIEPIQNHLRELNAISLLGASRSQIRLHIVITHDKTSGNISEVKIKKHDDVLRMQMKSLTKAWQPSMHEVYFQGEPEVAWRAVEELLTSSRADNEPTERDRSQEGPEGQRNVGIEQYSYMHES